MHRAGRACMVSCINSLCCRRFFFGLVLLGKGLIHSEATCVLSCLVCHSTCSSIHFGCLSWAPGSDLSTFPQMLCSQEGSPEQLPLLCPCSFPASPPSRALRKGSSAECCLSQPPSEQGAGVGASPRSWSQTPGHGEATEIGQWQEPTLAPQG